MNPPARMWHQLVRKIAHGFVRLVIGRRIATVGGAAMVIALPLTACTTIDTGEPGHGARGPDVDMSIRHRFGDLANTATAKNVILFIGDGMGVATVTAARIFDGQSRQLSGEEHSLAFETFPHVALVKTYNTNQQVPDSAGTASAMMTGKKTRAGVIGVGPAALRRDCASGEGRSLETIAEMAERRGKSTGIVTTTRITHATPAAVYAHTTERDFESDAYMSQAERAGCVDIATQLVGFSAGDGLDVALGGGYAEFVGSERGGIRHAASDDLIGPWLAADERRAFVRTRDELASIGADRQLLGLFADSHLEYVLQRAAESTEPTLAEMTAKAIDLLAEDPDGYFLMVEGGRIDHGHHIGRAGVALAEAQAFSAAIAVALERVDLGETLVLVTADHSHTMTMGGYTTRGNPILGLVRQNDDHGLPKNEPELAADGKPYASLAYANGPGAVDGERTVPDTHPLAPQQALVPTRSADRDGTVYISETHGGEDVALYAAGPWSQLVGGVLEQNAIFHIMSYAFGWRQP